MDYNEYVDAAEKGSALTEKGDFDAAIEIFKKLVSSDLASHDRAVMCMNIATIYEKKKDLDQALVWYGTGVDIESRHNGHFVYENRAAFLGRADRIQESLAYYEQLLTRNSLSESDKLRIRHNIQTLQKKSA